MLATDAGATGSNTAVRVMTSSRDANAAEIVLLHPDESQLFLVRHEGGLFASTTRATVSA